MSEAPPRAPRVILEEAAPRLDFPLEPAPAAPPPPRGGIGLALAGLATLLGGFALLSAVNLVADQFARGPVQGWTALGIALAGAALLGGGLAAEWRGLAALHAVDRARSAFARADLPAARAEAARWAATVPEAAPLLPALRQATSIEELRALLEAPQAALEARAGALGRTAALQAFAITAISPSPALDALVFAWRGIRLVRQVAALHGLRPGLAGSIALLRRVLEDAATIAATDLAVDAAARALLSNPLLTHMAGEAAAGAVAARRILRLARVAAEACRPVAR